MNEADRAEAVRLHVHEGLTFAEIGRRFGVTREWIRQVVRAASQPSLTHKRQRTASSYKRIARAVAVAARCESHKAEHGTRSKYVHGCRCEACTAAQREYMRSLKGKLPPPTHGHSGYVNYGCRCEVCTQANSDYHRNRNRRLKGRAV